MSRQSTLLIAAAVTVTLFGAEVRAEQELTVGEAVRGVTGQQEPIEYTVHLEEAGILTVAVRAEAGEDLVLKVTDGFYQPVPNGESDQDLGGNVGAEQIAATIARPGEYRVLVNTYNPRANFQMVSGFIAFPGLAAAAEPAPGATPGTAFDLPIGERHNESLTPGDAGMYQWFQVEAPGAGQLIIQTHGEEGDIVLSAYRADEFRDSVGHSDQDLEGNNAHETIVLSLEEGAVYFVRVGSVFQQPVPDYTIRATFVGD